MTKKQHNLHPHSRKEPDGKEEKDNDDGTDKKRLATHHLDAAMSEISDTDGAISAPPPNHIVTFQYPVLVETHVHRLVGALPSSSTKEPPNDDKEEGNPKEQTTTASKPLLDFIGPSAAVKDIFGLPYSADVGVAIAVHNLGNGTLLIDGAVVQDDETNAGNDNDGGDGDGDGGLGSKNMSMPFVKKKRKRPRSKGQTIVKENDNHVVLSLADHHSQSLRSPRDDEAQTTNQEQLLEHISDMMKMQKKYLSMVHVPPSQQQQQQQQQHQDASNVQLISIKNHTKQDNDCFETTTTTATATATAIATATTTTTATATTTTPRELSHQQEDGSTMEPHETLGHLLPAPEEYTKHLQSPSSNQQQHQHAHSLGHDHGLYQSWKFQKYNLLVSSDALVVKPFLKEDKEEDSTTTTTTTTTALATTLTTIDNHQSSSLDLNKTLTIRIVDCDQIKSKLSGGSGSGNEVAVQSKSYAQVLCDGNESSRDSAKNNDNAIVPYPDFARLSLQSCVLPSPDFQYHLHQHGFLARPVPVGMEGRTRNDNAFSTSSSSASSSSSPICMVLDAYLDNVIANVPQLALCLQERGLIQAVKLFETKELPNLSSKDLFLTQGYSESGILPGVLSHSKPLFSQSVVESNAALMLEFLKTNCCRENSTYLLTRNKGETKVQLLDVTSLSRQRQRKWIHWLAMISMRFAMRLENLGKEYDCDKSLKREYRQKKRGLLENALELFHELADMGGGNNETICASIYEQLADSFLLNAASCDENVKRDGPDSSECSFLLSGNIGIENMVYNGISIDSLSKASDFLKAGIKTVVPPLEAAFKRGNPDDDDGVSVEIEALTLQVYGLHHKLINVSLSQANKYLVKYRSSSVMQSLRLSARSISDAASLFLRIVNMSNKSEEFLGNESADFILSLAFQYSLLMENCGNFARSFAADGSWRERGHACGEDVIALLRDVELLSHQTNTVLRDYNSSSKKKEPFCITSKSKGIINLDYLSGLIPLSAEGHVVINAAKSMDMANEYLENQKQLKKDKRRVLVAACLSYGHAADIFSRICCDMFSGKSRLWPVLLQRLGDAHNEIGKVLLDDLQIIMRKDPQSKLITPFLLSAEWWFKEGLGIFELCSDVRNIALLHCNLSQCCKIRSSASSSRMNFRGRHDCVDRNLDSHAEICLNDAARHLELAHEALDQRDVHDTKAWDMVSLELASIYLLLGVRRRQLLIGQSSAWMSETLSPGAERSIVTPIKRAKEIFLSLGIDQKVAAADYQLALYFAKIWTCQRDEALTREKLSKAFSYFGQAHKYFFMHTESNEDTLVCLLLDLCSLYSTTSTSYECQEKALLCCLDSCRVFSAESVNNARNHASCSADWFTKMDSLHDKMEERILNLLSSLVKMEKHDRNLQPKYEAVYRRALEIKLGSNSERLLPSGTYRVFEILNVIKTNHLNGRS